MLCLPHLRAPVGGIALMDMLAGDRCMQHFVMKAMGNIASA